MSELPRKQQEYFNQIKKALGSDDEEMLTDILRNKNPLAIREDLATTLGQHVNENYDRPLNIFENQKLLEEIPVNYTENLPSGTAGKYIKEKGLYLPKENLSEFAKQTGVKVHEYGHANDDLKGFNDPQSFSRTKAIMKGTGLEAAENAIGKHHASGFFEKEALKDLLKNKKLKMIAPLAIGASALGIGNKAIAGEYGEAGLDTADLVTDYTPGVGQIKDAIRPTEMGNAELPLEEIIEKERFNKLRQRLLNK